MQLHARFMRLVSVLAGISVGAALMMSGTAQAQIGIGVSINVAPPELPVYEQPPMPDVGYMWSPGYWAWGGQDYYWVPGTWVLAPQPGFLWTPGYWGWGEGAYLWHAGYWGPHVGFYGGVNYGFGYVGSGYAGGYWQGGAFYYNRNVNNIPGTVHVTNVYNTTVVNNVTVNRVSFNGGTGGTDARPTAQEQAAAHEQHLPPVAEQVHQEQVARAEPALHTATNHGVPAIAATSHAGTLKGAGVVAAHGAAPPAAVHTAQPTHAPAPVREPAVHAAPPPKAGAPPAVVHTPAAPPAEVHTPTAPPVQHVQRPAPPPKAPAPEEHEHASPEHEH